MSKPQKNLGLLGLLILLSSITSFVLALFFFYPRAATEDSSQFIKKLEVSTSEKNRSKKPNSIDASLDLLTDKERQRLIIIASRLVAPRIVTEEDLLNTLKINISCGSCFFNLESERDKNIKHATEQFKLTPFSYNRPHALNYGKANKLILSIGSANALMSRQRAASGSGPVKSSEANLGGRVRASLDGPSQFVDIQLENQSEGGSAVKDLSSAANATWTWYVTPKTLDEVTLTLTIFNNVVIDGQEVELEGQAYVDTFTINASLWERWKDSLTSVWGIILGIGGLAGLVTAAIELLKWQKDRIALRKIMDQAHGNQLLESNSMKPSVKRRTTVKKKENQTDSK